MEHSEEYYKMKYFKYKAKYQQELARQSGGAESNSILSKGKELLSQGKNYLSTKVSSATKYSTEEAKVIKAINELNNIYRSIKNDDNNDIIKYLKEVNTNTTITQLKDDLNKKYFTEDNMKNLAEFKEAKIVSKNASYKILDKQCTPYIGNKIQESCIVIFNSQ